MHQAANESTDTGKRLGRVPGDTEQQWYGGSPALAQQSHQLLYVDLAYRQVVERRQLFYQAADQGTLDHQVAARRYRRHCAKHRAPGVTFDQRIGGILALLANGLVQFTRRQQEDCIVPLLPQAAGVTIQFCLESPAQLPQIGRTLDDFYGFGPIRHPADSLLFAACRYSDDRSLAW